jgi:hypothetical protein
VRRRRADRTRVLQSAGKRREIFAAGKSDRDQRSTRTAACSSVCDSGAGFSRPGDATLFDMFVRGEAESANPAWDWDSPSAAASCRRTAAASMPTTTTAPA